jgi:hypothetical protein
MELYNLAAISVHNSDSTMFSDKPTKRIVTMFVVLINSKRTTLNLLVYDASVNKILLTFVWP